MIEKALQVEYHYSMDFIAFDLETTGTVAGVDQIVEIGAVRFVNGKIDSVFSTLVNHSSRSQRRQWNNR